ncbi:uncharacterized protein LOC128821433 isoform X2 [Vidua macroura]|uniref:uncharacterized protein LOC128821433 isoform X2 n=1 Tax=Vidua macroura TaxID=187451 RepID=UPI0023A8AE03|nr:uncharacterized protein LOC128821433 isoform X2 [Vidua macroura]
MAASASLRRLAGVGGPPEGRSLCSPGVTLLPPAPSLSSIPGVTSAVTSPLPKPPPVTSLHAAQIFPSGFTEPQRDHQGWKGSLEITQSNPPAKAGSPGAGDTGTHPGGVGMSPEREILQPPCTAVPVLCHPQCKEVLPQVEINPNTLDVRLGGRRVSRRVSKSERITDIPNSLMISASSSVSSHLMGEDMSKLH